MRRNPEHSLEDRKACVRQKYLHSNQADIRRLALHGGNRFVKLEALQHAFHQSRMQHILESIPNQLKHQAR
jgi:hypothetical protein